METNANEKSWYVLDWKAPSQKVMADIMENMLSVEEQIVFAEACATLDENDNVTLDKKKGRDWLYSKFKDVVKDGKEIIEWKNYPTPKERPKSGAERIGDILRKKRDGVI